MKAAINKITEGAKRRDTLGRNICLAINADKDMSATDLINMLVKIQNTYSSDNLEKITNVILFSGTNAYLLKYRALDIANISPQAFADVKEMHKVTEALSKNEEGDDE